MTTNHNGHGSHHGAGGHVGMQAGEHAEGEHATPSGTPRTGVALVDGPSFSARPVQFVEIDGDAVAEGDILLGSADELLANPDATSDGLQQGVAIEQERFRWTDGVVPYVIADGFSARDRQEIVDAIAHWQARTNLRFPRRTTQANHVVFRPGTGCSSYVGMRGGAQPINLAPACSLGSVIHEIGHAVGLWHEQSREDRDRFVTVHYENVDPRFVSNFNKHVTDGVDVGRYDYASIMHYPRMAFSRNGRPTITPRQRGVTIGQRSALSAGDLATVRWMYPNLQPTRSWLGLQFRGTIPARSTRTWFTHSWPSYWYVDWSVMPLSPVGERGQQLSLDVRVTRQAERLATYHLVVTNHSSREVSFEARYAVQGWSRSARDPEGDQEAADAPEAPLDAGPVDPSLGVTVDVTDDDGDREATPAGAGPRA